MTKAIVFDIGGVLVDWQPHLAWVDDLGSAEAAYDFMERTNFLALNTRGDNGERFADLAKEVADPADGARIAAYVSLYTRTVQNVVPGTWEVLDDLKAKGVPIHAITNWSAETWPEGLKVHPRLGEVFGTTIVSGQEGVLKPDARIFDLLCTRARLSPSECVFIDDSPKNVDGAKAAGWDAIHFTTAQDLADALSQRGVL